MKGDIIYEKHPNIGNIFPGSEKIYIAEYCTNNKRISVKTF